MSRIFDRRTFLKNSALLVTASPALSNPGSAPAGALTAGEEGSQVAALEAAFSSPRMRRVRGCSGSSATAR